MTLRNQLIASVLFVPAAFAAPTTARPAARPAANEPKAVSEVIAYRAYGKDGKTKDPSAYYRIVELHQTIRGGGIVKTYQIAQCELGVCNAVGPATSYNESAIIRASEGLCKYKDTCTREAVLGWGGTGASAALAIAAIGSKNGWLKGLILPCAATGAAGAGFGQKAGQQAAVAEQCKRILKSVDGNDSIREMLIPAEHFQETGKLLASFFGEQLPKSSLDAARKDAQDAMPVRGLDQVVIPHSLDLSGSEVHIGQ